MARIIITPGDPRGIGPEVTIKAFRAGPFQSKKNQASSHQFTFIGGLQATEIAELKKMGHETILSMESPPDGWNTESAGRVSANAFEKAISLIQAGQADAVVTGPIDKDALRVAGFKDKGHTDFLERVTGCPTTMMLANPVMRVSLVTTHVALKDVSSKLTAEKIRATTERTLAYLKDREQIARPHIAILALNPHAGDQGLMGHEEIQTIVPTCEKLRVDYPDCEIGGPFPADGFFARVFAELRAGTQKYDAIIAMYHDQGLIPVKAYDFARTVNLTLGLPFVRTSVDHGTAYDIAGRGIADASSMRAAIEKAIDLLA